MMQHMIWLMGIGYVFELGGFALTGRGLYVTWRDNADGRPFWPPKLSAVVRKIMGKTPEVHAVFGSSVGELSMAAHGYVVEKVDPEAPVSDQIATLGRNIERAMEQGSQAHTAIAQETGERKQAIKALEAEIQRVEQSSERLSKDLAVGGIWMTVVGLGCAIFGLLLQIPGSMVSCC